MGIKIKIAGIIRQSTNWQDIVEVDGSTPLECIDDLLSKYPDARKWIYNKHGEMLDRFQIMVNGEQIQPGQFKAPVSPTDELSIVLNICGG